MVEKNSLSIIIKQMKNLLKRLCYQSASNNNNKKIKNFQKIPSTYSFIINFIWKFIAIFRPFARERNLILSFRKKGL